MKQYFFEIIQICTVSHHICSTNSYDKIVITSLHWNKHYHVDIYYNVC